MGVFTISTEKFLNVIPIMLLGGLELWWITGGPRLVGILGPGKNRTSEIRTSEYYIANFQ